MAVLGTTALTLADWAARRDDKGVAIIVDLLSQANEVLDDMLWLEGNLTTGHKTTVVTSLPTGTWRPMNVGITKAKGTTAQLVATCGNLEGLSDVDKDIADLAGDKAAFLLSESRLFLEGISQQMAGQIFYGYAPTAPAQFTGIAPFYATATSSNAATAANVIDMGGTASTNASMWLLTWSEEALHGIFPKGKKAGLIHEDQGEWWATDSNSNPYKVYRQHFKWEAGLALRDWRFQVRAANIDVTTLIGGTAPNLINALDRMLERPPRLKAGASSTQRVNDQSGVVSTGDRSVLYMNRVLRTWLRIQMHNKPNVLLSIDNWDGKPVMSYCGIPIRTVDQLLSSEARVV